MHGHTHNGAYSLCQCYTMIQQEQLYPFCPISNSLSLFFPTFHPHKPTSTHRHACFVFSNGVSVDAAELDDCVYLFWGAAPCPKSALICYSFFDSSAMVGCMDGRLRQTHTALPEKKLLFWSCFFGCIFFCCMMALISLMAMSKQIQTSCSLCQTDVNILLVLTPSFSVLSPVDVCLSDHNNLYPSHFPLTEE